MVHGDPWWLLKNAWYFHSEKRSTLIFRDPRESNHIQSHSVPVLLGSHKLTMLFFLYNPLHAIRKGYDWLDPPRLWITWKTDATFKRFFGALRDWDEDFDLVPCTNKYPRNWWWENLQKTLYLAETIVTHRISLKPMAMYTAQECASGKLSLCSVARARKCWEET